MNKGKVGEICQSDDVRTMYLVRGLICWPKYDTLMSFSVVFFFF